MQEGSVGGATVQHGGCGRSVRGLPGGVHAGARDAGLTHHMNPIGPNDAASGPGHAPSPGVSPIDSAMSPPMPDDGMAWQSTTPELHAHTSTSSGGAGGAGSAGPRQQASAGGRGSDAMAASRTQQQQPAGVGPSSTAAAAAAAAVRARPGRAFVPFAQGGQAAAASGSAPGRRQALVCGTTVSLVQTYRRCNEHFQYSNAKNPKRVLTKPSVGSKNDGYDNDNSDLILYVNDVLINHQPSNGICRRYIIQDMLGQGTFGQVVACWCEELKKSVAVKVIKNQPAYYHQARVEIGLLQFLNTRCDANDEHHIVRMSDFFLFRKHLCLVFEKLDVNLFELLKRNTFRGLSLSLVQLFLRQILDALTVLRDASIIHCDLKPENILLNNPTSGEIKLIDFGSACFEHRTVYSYIQSRFYRSPEVVLGTTYNVAIDMWSLGCVAAELFLGLPLFPGASEHDLLVRVTETLGTPPPWLLADAKHASKFFRTHVVQEADGSVSTRYMLMPRAEFEAQNACKAPAGKRYFNHVALPDIVHAYPMKAGLVAEEVTRERLRRAAFCDFLLGVLHIDPRQRWTPRQAASHPFITGAPFAAPYVPPADERRPLTSLMQDAVPIAGRSGGGGAPPMQSSLPSAGHLATAAAAAAHLSQRQQQDAAAAAARGGGAHGHAHAPQQQPLQHAGAAAAQGGFHRAMQQQTQQQQAGGGSGLSAASSAHAQAQAHAIAYATLQQLSPQFSFLSSSIGAGQHANHLMGTPYGMPASMLGTSLAPGLGSSLPVPSHLLSSLPSAQGGGMTALAAAHGAHAGGGAPGGNMAISAAAIQQHAQAHAQRQAAAQQLQAGAAGGMLASGQRRAPQQQQQQQQHIALGATPSTSFLSQHMPSLAVPQQDQGSLQHQHHHHQQSQHDMALAAAVAAVNAVNGSGQLGTSIGGGGGALGQHLPPGEMQSVMMMAAQAVARQAQYQALLQQQQQQQHAQQQTQQQHFAHRTGGLAGLPAGQPVMQTVGFQLGGSGRSSSSAANSMQGAPSPHHQQHQQQQHQQHQQQQHQQHQQQHNHHQASSGSHGHASGSHSGNGQGQGHSHGRGGGGGCNMQDDAMSGLQPAGSFAFQLQQAAQQQAAQLDALRQGSLHGGSAADAAVLQQAIATQQQQLLLLAAQQQLQQQQQLQSPHGGAAGAAPQPQAQGSSMDVDGLLAGGGGGARSSHGGGQGGSDRGTPESAHVSASPGDWDPLYSDELLFEGEARGHGSRGGGGGGGGLSRRSSRHQPLPQSQVLAAAQHAAAQATQQQQQQQQYEAAAAAAAACTGAHSDGIMPGALTGMSPLSPAGMQPQGSFLQMPGAAMSGGGGGAAHNHYPSATAESGSIAIARAIAAQQQQQQQQQQMDAAAAQGLAGSLPYSGVQPPVINLGYWLNAGQAAQLHPQPDAHSHQAQPQHHHHQPGQQWQ